MTGCGRGFQSTGYCDWEEAMQDGRIAWTNSQWVIAHISHHQDRPRLFVHKEVDQESPRLYCFICDSRVQYEVSTSSASFDLGLPLFDCLFKPLISLIYHKLCMFNSSD